MKCRFIDTGFNAAYGNMAIDEAILSCCKEPALRVYQWSSPSISVGYNQAVRKEINIEKCKENSIDIVRRVTGGKAVLHDKEITYSLILPEGAIALPQDVAESYKIIANALVFALQKIGVKAQIKQQPEKVATPICFNSQNWYELTVNEKKISGSAQRRLQGKILQHGPILMDFDFEKNAVLFISNDSKELAENLRKKITSIKHELGIDISYKEMVDAVKYGFQKNFKMNFFDDALTKEEIELSKKLRNEKYSLSSWNFRL